MVHSLVSAGLGLVADCQTLVKVGARIAVADDLDKPAVTYNLAGTLHLGANGWLLLTVPNALVRGLFQAMREPGIELPPGPNGTFNANIGVMSPAELTHIGGADKITERGKQYHYTLGRLYAVDPALPGIDRAWYVYTYSSELQELRKSYGLDPLPDAGRRGFYVVVAVRRRGVLARNETSKSEGASAGTAPSSTA